MATESPQIATFQDALLVITIFLGDPSENETREVHFIQGPSLDWGTITKLEKIWSGLRFSSITLTVSALCIGHSKKENSPVTANYLQFPETQNVL